MKWKYLRYVMKNKNSKNPWKRMIVRWYTMFLRRGCRRERRYLAKRYIRVAPPKYTAKDILQKQESKQIQRLK